MARVIAATLGLILLLSSATPIIASPDEVKWSIVSIPSEGKSGNWVLAPGSDIQQLTMAADGALYAYGQGLDYTLYKSTDDGYSWSYTGEVEDEIVAIAAAPDDADTIYYATQANVFKSTDGSHRFTQLAGNPGGAGSNHLEITAIDVTMLGGSRLIVVATRDRDAGQFGGVYILNEGKPFSGWVDTNIGSYDVYAIAFSPDFTTDQQLVAVVTNETDTLVTTKIGAAIWGHTIGDAKLDNSGTPVAVDASSAIVFPNDYDINDGYVQFVAIDAGSENGDVYVVNGVESPSFSIAIDLNIGASYGLSSVDVTGLAISGSAATANLLAGAAGSAEVYLSTDGGESWTKSTKPPTGESRTYIVTAPDFLESGKTYVATSGSGSSAVSSTEDGGRTWNQISLIDTDIKDIIDLAPSPDYSQDDTLFMITWGGEHSLWRSSNGGQRWERVYATALADVDQIDWVALPPEYGHGRQVVFIAGSSNGSPAIWKSTDNGQEFTRRRAPCPVDTLAVANDQTLFIGGYNGSHRLVYRTTNSGLTYSAGAVAGSHSLNSIALSPDYGNDILIGNISGWVYLSDDNGASFEPVGQQLPELIAGGSDSNSITVAFDADYSRNNTIYAASHCKKGMNNSSAIYRFIIGKSTKWERISTLPTGSIVSQLKVAADGTLYATNLKADGGLERCLNPTYPLGPTFETVTRGLDDGATLAGLRLCGNRLWAIDTTNTQLLEFNDTLTVPVTLASPADEAPGVGQIASDEISNVSLDWEVLSGADEYRWQLDYETDFTTVPPGFEGDAKASSARLPPLEPATKYYWRVRVTEPVFCPWSAKWSFTTSLGTETAAPKPYTPEAGASDVPTRPVFQWSDIVGAQSYELLIASDISFASPIITRVGDYALPATAWKCDIDLAQDVTYYWKVRAISSDSHSAWSATYAFTTESPPPEATPPAPPPSPSPSTTTPDWMWWLIVLGSALLVTMMAMMVVMIIIAVRIRR